MANKRRRLSDNSIWALAGIAAIAVLLFVLWWGPWLFTRHPSSDLTDADALKAKNDVRTTLVQAVAGLAVAAGAFVTYRTFRQNQVDQANRHDREERTYKLNQSQQVTDTYTKAVEQLGHDEAPVRLGALYSLVSLAQDNPSRRQTVVDVLCAYLRMPYSPPRQEEVATEPASTAAGTASPPNADEEKRHRDAVQELQVRQTAQRLLVDHLRGPRGTSSADAQSTEPSPEATFWPGISIDLAGASLIRFSPMTVSVIRADFSRATFFDDLFFMGATFSEYATFDGATFSGNATFYRATFSNVAIFNEAIFSGLAIFDSATFSEDAIFNGATFSENATFGGATFKGISSFYMARSMGKFPPGVWPDGWTVRPDEDDPSRGTLVPAVDGKAADARPARTEEDH